MSMIFCRGCGKQIHETAPKCPHCGAVQAGAAKVEVAAEPPIPAGVKGWSWGAFFLNWIWAIGNRTWIGLLALIPYVGFIMAIVLGFKGREWAWKNKQWDSVEHFNAVQKKWSFWGVAVCLTAAVIGLIAAVAIPKYESYQREAKAAIERQRAEEARAAYEAERAAQEAAEQEARKQAQLAAQRAAAAGWSAEFREQVLKQCMDTRANAQAWEACKCIVETSSKSIPEQRMKSLEVDPEANAAFSKIIAGCEA